MRSPVPVNTSAPRARASAAWVWDQQPQTATTASGCSRRTRWTICRDFWSLTAVTEQVLMIQASASWPKGATVCPRAWSSRSMAWLSYWFTLQPRV